MWGGAEGVEEGGGRAGELRAAQPSVKGARRSLVLMRVRVADARAGGRGADQRGDPQPAGGGGGDEPLMATSTRREAR